jgi:hypothetical protein
MHATQSQLAALSNRHDLYNIVRLYLFRCDLTIIRQRLPKPPARRGTLGITEDGEEYDRLADQQERASNGPDKDDTLFRGKARREGHRP